eukprot:749202-Hanusia_phi.AAC.1
MEEEEGEGERRAEQGREGEERRGGGQQKGKERKGRKGEGGSTWMLGSSIKKFSASLPTRFSIMASTNRVTGRSFFPLHVWSQGEIGGEGKGMERGGGRRREEGKQKQQKEEEG